MATFSSRSALVVDGVDATVRSFTLKAVEARVKADAVVVRTAGRAADLMRALVPVDEGDLLDSITADRQASMDGLFVYADAGPSREANRGAFKAPWIESGTVKMSPQPFVGPAADRVLPEFELAMRALL